MRWRLILEEFSPELKYIKGTHNVVADALSCLDFNENTETVNIAEAYGYDDDDLPDNSFPVRYRDIAKAQSQELDLQKKLSTNNNYKQFNSEEATKITP